MNRLLKISEAASLALHTMTLLATNRDETLTAKEMASKLHVSEAHLSKVLQRLAKMGLLRSARGPRGGFKLARKSRQISLLEIYESIEGPLATGYCLLDRPICGGNGCIFGDLIKKLDTEIREYLTKTTLAGIARVYEGKADKSRTDEKTGTRNRRK